MNDLMCSLPRLIVQWSCPLCTQFTRKANEAIELRGWGWSDCGGWRGGTYSSKLKIISSMSDGWIFISIQLVSNEYAIIMKNIDIVSFAMSVLAAGNSREYVWYKKHLFIFILQVNWSISRDCRGDFQGGAITSNFIDHY